MAGKKRRTNKHRKSKYDMYKSSQRREKNKARRIIADAKRSANPKETIKKILAKISNAILKEQVDRLAVRL